MSALVDFRGVTIFQDDRPVVGNLSVQVNAGEFVYLLGKTGSGKTSFLRTLYGDLKLASGEATVCGYNLAHLRQREIPYLRRKLGIVFQDFQLLSDRSVYKNLQFVMRATGWRDKKKIRARIEEVLSKVDLAGRENKMPHELSGGEQQRISIARALVNEPELIIADEPTGNLDPQSSEEIVKLLRELVGTGRSVLFATHDMLLYNKFRSRTLFFENGQMMERL